MLNSAKIIPAAHRKCTTSEKREEGGGGGGFPGPATVTWKTNTKNKLGRTKTVKLETKTGTFTDVQAKVNKNFEVHFPWERIPQI